jgi:hypothetical protein
MLPSINDLFSVAISMKTRSEATPPDDVQPLADVRDLALQLRLVMRLGREENALVVAAETWLDEVRADLAVALLVELLAKRVSV